MVEYGIIFIISAAVIFFAAKYFAIKKQMKGISEQLNDYENSLISIELIDDDLEYMVVRINSLIEDMKQIRIDAEKGAKDLKLSVADISHDMRTPLTSVIGYLQLAKKECKEDDVRENIDIALERAVYLSTLINEFFEISVLEQTGCSPCMEKVDISGLLCEQILANAPLFHEKSITPYFEEADIPVFAYADKNMLIRIIQNLISNSINYTSGDVDFAVSSCDNAVILSVSNPTDEEKIDTEHIFDKFYRPVRAGRSMGGGLGLYICRNFAWSMGGEIEAVFEDGWLRIKLRLRSVE